MRIFLAMIVGDMTRFLLWLFDGGFDLLAVDEDGDSSCAALCHSLKFWQSWHKCPSQDGTVWRNRNRAFDCGFVSLMSATTIAVMSTQCEI